MLKLKLYQSHKRVHAEPMQRGDAWSEGWVRASDPVPMDEPGYHVVYNQGTDREYHSWSPAQEFEEGYTEVPDVVRE